MNVHALVLERIVGALKALEGEGVLPAGLDPAGIEVTPPRAASRGELSSNAALVLAKAARMKPREIAARLAEKLRAHPDTETVEVAGAGFLNLRFAPRFWHGVVAAILREGSAYGRSNLGRGERVNVEHVTAYATAPMHADHCRGVVFGDALANLLAFAGYDVTRELRIDGATAQVYQLARSAFLHYREALGEDVGAIPASLYPGDDLEAVGAALAREHGATLLGLSEAQWLPIVRETAVAVMLGIVRRDLAALNVRYEVRHSEPLLMVTGGAEAIKVTIDELREKGLVHRGSHHGGACADGRQMLFMSTDLGADDYRTLLEVDGRYSYLAGGVAFYHAKLRCGFKHLVGVCLANPAEHLACVKPAVMALSGGKTDLDIKVCEPIRVLRAGELVPTRDLRVLEILDEVGCDAVRFMMLYRKHDTLLNFDLAKVADRSKDNPVFYVQYAHARAKSIFRHAQEMFPELQEGAARVIGSDLSLLSDPGEINLIRKLAQLPTLVEGAARAREPHRLAVYLYDLASCFHSHYALGNDLPHSRFIQPFDGTLTAARLALVQATAQVLAVGLALLGVLAPLEMR